MADRTSRLIGAAALAGLAMPVAAQQPEGRQQDASRRTRVALGVQAVPDYPGADGIGLRPLVDVARADGDDPFAFEAPDESFGLPLVTLDRLTIGPVLGFEGSRRSRDVGGLLPTVGFTVEPGGFVQYELSDRFRLRGEVRKGIGGHRGVIANLGADYVWRDADNWLASIGPRVTIADARYNRAYFGVAPADAAVAGIPAYAVGGGVQAVGVTAGYLRQLTPRWGVYSYAKYDRLVGAPADSPLVARFGSRDQASAGLGLSYTFGRGR